MSKYSVIIKNGAVFDGKNNKPQKVDVGIEGDQITKIGDLQKESAPNIIDARGKYVMPGFIDLTSHSDTHWTLFSAPSQESLISQGITTILGGNCGSSLAPFVDESSAKEIGRWTDPSKININWGTMDEFLEELEWRKIGVNFATLVGLNTLRKSIKKGDQKTEKVKILLKSSLEAGAFGLSTNFGMPGPDFFSYEEVTDILSVLKEHNAVAKHHLEDEGENILPSISRLIGIARNSGSKMHLSHLKAVGRKSWKDFCNAFNMINIARGEGIKISCDFFPYTKTGSSLIMLTPIWFRKLSEEESMEILSSRNNEKRDSLVSYLKEITLHYENIIIASAKHELGVVGKTIKEISASSDSEPEEIILDLLKANDLRVSIFNEVISEENNAVIAKDDFSAVASDGVGYNVTGKNLDDLPHPRSFGAFPRAIVLYAKENGIIPWETIIYKMTGLPASILGIENRGALEKGKKADIVVINPDEIADQSTYENPFKLPSGVENVFINGEAALTNGSLTGKLSGRVLRKK